MSANKTGAGYYWGLVLIIIGLLFLFQNFDMFDIGDFISTFWPLILVAIGLKILYDRRKQVRPEPQESATQKAAVRSSQTADDKLYSTYVFGDVNIIVDNEQFRGGSVSNVFGDMFIDLSKAKPGRKEVRVYLNGIFGDIEVQLPRGIPVRLKANTIIGDIKFRDETKEWFLSNLQAEDPDFAKAELSLILNCSIIFGGIKVV